MTISLQLAALNQCVDSRKEELGELLKTYQLPQECETRYNWAQIKKTWQEKKVSLTSKFSDDLSGLVFISPYKIMLAFRGGAVRVWNLYDGNKQAFQMDYRFNAILSNAASLAYVTECGRLLFSNKERPQALLSTYDIGDSFRDGKFISPSTVIIANQSKIKLYDLRTSKSVSEVAVKNNNLYSLAVSADSKCYLSAKNRKVEVLDLRLPEINQFIEDPVDRFSNIIVHKGRVFTSTYLTDHKVKVWNSTNGHLEGVMNIRGCFASSLSIDRKNHILSTGSQDGHVQLWDISGKYPSVLRESAPKKGYPVISSALHNRVYVTANRTGQVVVGCV
jgi:WD40 repeat protein